MNRDYVLDDYFDWLYFAVVPGQPIADRPYRKLLSMLHNMDFRYSIPFDENRAADGRNLRWYYVNDGGDDSIMDWKAPCTVLEVLISLAMHMESIMGEPGDDYSVPHWFWWMLSNLDLDEMTDDRYDKTYVYGRVSMFLDRTYEPDGYGNIIFIPNTKEDLRKVELWHQMCWYLDSIL